MVGVLGHTPSDRRARTSTTYVAGRGFYVTTIRPVHSDQIDAKPVQAVLDAQAEAAAQAEAIPAPSPPMPVQGNGLKGIEKIIATHLKLGQKAADIITKNEEKKESEKEKVDAPGSRQTLFDPPGEGSRALMEKIIKKADLQKKEKSEMIKKIKKSAPKVVEQPKTDEGGSVFANGAPQEGKRMYGLKRREERAMG